jgi:asparagine synthase (glutamine-hydrolysing)
VCGIAGIAATNGDRIDVDALDRMIGAIAHRGPDGCDAHVEAGIGLAHARLSIIDLHGGAQPMSNEDASLWIVFNGEIFNYVELRASLVRRGHRFRTQSDTEVILHLYEERGVDAVHALNGQWAFAIWDARARSVFLSRDRVGVRPLFYTTVRGQLLFASEIKALFAHPSVPRALDPRGLDNIFTCWCTLPPRTAFRDINELAPGRSLMWRGGDLRETVHWQPSFATEAAPVRTVDEWVDELDAVLTRATAIRLRADVPVGSLLSGGLDSSLVTSVAARICGAAPRTFSIVFDDPEFDESFHQRRLAAALGSSHREWRCSYRDIVAAFPAVVWHAETPVLRTAPAPVYRLAKSVRDAGCKVVLSGEGADEVFGGYGIFKEAKVRAFWARQPDSTWRPALLARAYPSLARFQRQPNAFRGASFHMQPDEAADPCFSHLPRWRLTSRLKAFFSAAMRASLDGFDSIDEVASRLPADFRGWDALGRAQYLEMAHLLPGYILSSQGDRMAMAHGVEARFPFLDPDVVALGARLPSTLKLRRLDEKYLLKALARRVVPAPVWRRAKQPYRAPASQAFFSHAGEYVDDLLSPRQVAQNGVFDPRAVDLLLRKCRAGRAIGEKDNMAFVGILSTQLLFDRFINHFEVSHGAHRRSAAVHHR